MIKSKISFDSKTFALTKGQSLLSYCPITAIPALKIGHTCTASTATTDCGNATTTHLECSATTPTVCVCSTGYSGSPGGDCGRWHIHIVYCGRRKRKKKKKKKTHKKHSAACSTWRSLCPSDSYPLSPTPNHPSTPVPHPGMIMRGWRDFKF